MKHLCVFVGIAACAGIVVSAQPPGAVVEELTRLSRTVEDAAVKKDRATLERLYSDDYSFIHSNGTVQTKTQDIADLASGDIKWTSVTVTDVNVRTYGDAAIRTQIETLQGTEKGYVPGPRQTTNVWVKREGRWQQVAGEATIVSKDKSPTAAPSAIKTLTAKTVAATNADARAVLQADEAHARADGANDDAKAKALETKDYSFVSRLGVVASASDSPPTPTKSLVTAYDRLSTHGTVAVVQGSLLWTDVKGFSPGVLRFMRVWVKEGTGWKLAAEQRTPITSARPTT